MIMEPLPSTTEIPQPVSTEVDDPFAVISNNKPGFRYMYPQAAPTPINEDDVVWNKIYTAANSRMYNKHHKNANEARKYREAGETRVLALRMLASNKVKHDLAVAAAKLAGVPFSSSTSKTSEPTRKNPYDSFKGGALFLLGVLRDGAFHCQHLQLCPQRFETAEELRIHFELAHFHFTRISPASRYICSTCENITPCLNGPCSCRTTESIELWICGRFIKTPGSKYSPSPCPDSDLKTDTDETISESCQDPEHTPESTQNRKRSSVSSSPSQKRPRVTEPGSDSDTIDLFPCKSCDLPPFRDEASFHQHIISNHITTTRSDRKLEFSKRRAIGACTDCRRRKVRVRRPLPQRHRIQILTTYSVSTAFPQFIKAWVEFLRLRHTRADGMTTSHLFMTKTKSKQFPVGKLRTRARPSPHRKSVSALDVAKISLWKSTPRYVICIPELLALGMRMVQNEI